MENIQLCYANMQAILPKQNEFCDVVEALNYNSQMTGWRNLMSSDELNQIIDCGKAAAKKYENVVLLGTGGSALGAKAAFFALRGENYNLMPKKNSPRFFVCDNIDAESNLAVLDYINIKNTLFVVVTKSGATVETLSQMSIVCDVLKELKLELSQHIIVVSGNEAFKSWAQSLAISVFSIPDNIGGRFSLFTAAGLLPLACTGIDIRRLIEGANDMRSRSENTFALLNPSLIYAHLMHNCYKSGKSQAVFFPYGTQLKHLSEWYCQLWAESLGKNGGGQTPIKANGATDQHSLLQMLVEGEKNKAVTFVEYLHPNLDYVVPPSSYNLANELTGYSLHKLLLTQLAATEKSLTAVGVPNMKIQMDCLNEHNLGQFAMMMFYSVCFCGYLQQVNAYTQDGVEGTKKTVKAMLKAKRKDG